MAQTLLTILADFNTQLTTAPSIGDTTATLASATDDDGVALPSGTYGFTVDAGNSSKEYIIADLSSTSLTNIKSISRQGASTTGFARAHRRGAKVTVTDWAILSRMLKNLNGTTGFNSLVKLGYDADPSLTSGDTNKFATVKYVNDTAIAGAPDASSTVKGISKLSVDPVSPTAPIAVGDNDTRVPTQGENDALVGNNTDVAVGTGNKFVTQTGLQHAAEVFAVDGSSSSTAYTATLSPVPTSLTNGMTVRVKIGLANTTTTPSLNVNSLGAKTIVKGVTTALAVGDIAAGQYCTFVYDSTNTVWVLQNPTATTTTSGLTKVGKGTFTRTGADGTGTQNIAHGLGITPKLFSVTLTFANGTNSERGMGHGSATSTGGISQSCVWFSGTNNTNTAGSSTSDVIKVVASSAGTDYGIAQVTAMDATNVTLNWSVAAGTNLYTQWEAFA